MTSPGSVVMARWSLPRKAWGEVVPVGLVDEALAGKPPVAPDVSDVAGSSWKRAARERAMTPPSGM